MTCQVPYFYKIRFQGGGPDGQKDQLFIDHFRLDAKVRTGGFRYPTEYSKTVQKWNVFYT